VHVHRCNAVLKRAGGVTSPYALRAPLRAIHPSILRTARRGIKLLLSGAEDLIIRASTSHKLKP